MSVVVWRCSDCGAEHFPRPWICLRCGAEELGTRRKHKGIVEETTSAGPQGPVWATVRIGTAAQQAGSARAIVTLAGPAPAGTTVALHHDPHHPKLQHAEQHAEPHRPDAEARSDDARAGYLPGGDGPAEQGER